jgi:beta-xylosidase
MKKTTIICLMAFVAATMLTGTVKAQAYDIKINVRKDVPLDSIRMSDPFVFADTISQTYYMTGTGGMLWKSKDLAKWEGPYRPFKINPQSWMGPKPMVWAAEIHKYKDKYYFFATFTNMAVNIDTVQANIIPRRACHVLVSNSPDGPYIPVSDKNYLPADKPTLDATLWFDTDNKPYMVYCHEWLQNRNGTVEKILLTDDFSTTMGNAKILFKASESPWSRETTDDGSVRPNMVTDGPFLFRTATGKLGMIWTSWIRDIYTQGVAYSQSGTLDGPWIQEPQPITPPNFGHGMLFTTFDGRTLMSLHSHKKISQDHVDRRPHFFNVSLEGNRLKVLGEYKP